MNQTMSQRSIKDSRQTTPSDYATAAESLSGPINESSSFSSSNSVVAFCTLSPQANINIAQAESSHSNMNTSARQHTPQPVRHMKRATEISPSSRVYKLSDLQKMQAGARHISLEKLNISAEAPLGKSCCKHLLRLYFQTSDHQSPLRDPNQ